MQNTVAQEIMSSELITVLEDETVEGALKALINNRVTGLPVVNRDGRLVGVFSEYDIIKQISRHGRLTPAIFQDRIEYSHEAFTVAPNTSLTEIVEHFLSAKYRRIPVVDAQGRLVGIITRRDLMRVFYYRATLG
jgi:CBS domain-containing protein